MSTRINAAADRLNADRLWLFLLADDEYLARRTQVCEQPLLTRLIGTLGLTVRECRAYNRGMDELSRKEVWSDDDDVLLKAWMAIYENPLTPPLTFQVINGAGESVSVSALDVGPHSSGAPWWEGWSCVFPVTIQVRDIHGKGFSVSLPHSKTSSTQ